MIQIPAIPIGDILLGVFTIQTLTLVFIAMIFLKWNTGAVTPKRVRQKVDKFLPVPKMPKKPKITKHTDESEYVKEQNEAKKTDTAVWG